MTVDSTATIFRYRPLAPIGRGGMAEVVLALTETRAGGGTPVVLKRIWPELVEDPDFVAMFRDEARLAIRLDHPNVVRTHELIEDAAQLAIAMEYLHGQPLAALLSREERPGELSVNLRLRILVDVLAGLHYAHELTDAGGNLLGVVHRDVSPENVFVTYDGQVKLMDFGVAQMSGTVHRTRPGTLKGKLSYIAPEYIRGGGVDRRADVFAVGVMLWELLTGRRLWQGMGEAQIVHYLAAGMPMPPLPTDRRRPVWLAQVCARALAVDPDERYATAAALGNDLQRALVGPADIHARLLGRVVSQSFKEARVEREALLARALAGSSHAAPAPGWVKEIDAVLPSVDGFFEETVVDEWVPPESPPLVPAPSQARVRAGLAVLASVVVAVGLVVAQADRDARTALPATPTGAVSSASAAPVAPPLWAFPAVSDAVAPAPAAGGFTRANRRLGRRGAERADEGRREAAPPDDGADRLRPASVRAIDESDPFR